MKSNSLENLIADQLFKISKSDESILNYMLDSFSHFNNQMDVQENKIFCNGTN